MTDKPKTIVEILESYAEFYFWRDQGTPGEPKLGMDMTEARQALQELFDYVLGTSPAPYQRQRMNEVMEGK